MPNERKIKIVASLKEKLAQSQGIILADYRGLKHQQLEEVRKSLRNLGAEFKVVKNSLLKLALRGIRYQVSGVKIEGPTAILLTFNEDLTPLKVIHEKGEELGSLKIKWGLWGGEVLRRERVLQLATLPSREVLLGQLLSQMISPQTRLLYALKGNLQKLALILKSRRM